MWWLKVLSSSSPLLCVQEYLCIYRPEMPKGDRPLQAAGTRTTRGNAQCLTVHVCDVCTVSDIQVWWYM